MSQDTSMDRESQRAFIGKYVLESISIGVYDHPLMSIREYVQNSADAIDDFCSIHGGTGDNDKAIEVTIDGRSKSVKIQDKGCGVRCETAWEVLHGLGRSDKDIRLKRGFRGIGRLGGLGYCRELRFTTKAEGQSLVSTSTWNCEELRRLINENTEILDAATIVDGVAEFEQYGYSGPLEDHFFIVEMIDAGSSKNWMLNVPAVRYYLSQVAPVPFHPTNFSFGRKIDEELRLNVPSYATYTISVNGEQIYKPYADSVNILKGGDDPIRDISFYTLSEGTRVLAFGWLAELSFLGAINPAGLVDGVRVRSGNILIGDKNLLAEFYRELRFGGYVVGEIHVVNKGLIPNSRRDDFEDNDAKSDFYSSFIREIGIPYSKKIRALSQYRSKMKRNAHIDSLYSRAQRIAESGYMAEVQKQEVAQALQKISESGQGAAWANCESLIRNVLASKHVLDNGHNLLRQDLTNTYKDIFEIIYREADNKTEAEAIIGKILDEVNA